MNIVLSSFFSSLFVPNIQILEKFNTIEKILQAWCSLLFFIFFVCVFCLNSLGFMFFS